jgi:hypothetical protein
MSSGIRRIHASKLKLIFKFMRANADKHETWESLTEAVNSFILQNFGIENHYSVRSLTALTLKHFRLGLRNSPSDLVERRTRVRKPREESSEPMVVRPKSNSGKVDEALALADLVLQSSQNSNRKLEMLRVIVGGLQ